MMTWALNAKRFLASTNVSRRDASHLCRSWRTQRLENRAEVHRPIPQTICAVFPRDRKSPHHAVEDAGNIQDSRKHFSVRNNILQVCVTMTADLIPVTRQPCMLLSFGPCTPGPFDTPKNLQANPTRKEEARTRKRNPTTNNRGNTEHKGNNTPNQTPEESNDPLLLPDNMCRQEGHCAIVLSGLRLRQLESTSRASEEVFKTEA